MLLLRSLLIVLLLVAAAAEHRKVGDFSRRGLGLAPQRGGQGSGPAAMAEVGGRAELSEALAEARSSGLRRFAPDRAEAQASANSTDGAMGDMGGLKDVLLVITNVRMDRRDLLEGYKRFFWGVWYAPASGGKWGNQLKAGDTTQCMGLAGIPLPTHQCTDAMIKKIRDNEGMIGAETSLRVARLLRVGTAGEAHSGSSAGEEDIGLDLQKMQDRPPRGFLQLHMDMWFNPKIFEQRPLDVDKIWRPRKGLVDSAQHVIERRCLSGASLRDDHRTASPETGWFSDEDMKYSGVRAALVAKRAGVEAAQQWPDDRACYGWTDMLYLPRKAWTPYEQLNAYFHNVFHEIAVPTIQSMIVNSGAADEEVLDCAGTCCIHADHLDIARHICGHKMFLHMDHDRQSFASILGLPPPPPATDTGGFVG